MFKIVAFLHISLAMASANVQAEGLPQSILNKIPRGYVVLTHANGKLNDDELTDYLVVVQKAGEANINSLSYAAERPLLLFTQKPLGNYELTRRNDHVVFRLDEGGQCDPFLDSGNGLTIKDHYFTVENGVACGQHWSDYITFKYVPALKDWVFHQRIYEASHDVADQNGKFKRVVQKAAKKRKILFEEYYK